MKRALVVEDNEDNLLLCRLLLQKSGYEVIEARDGDEAVMLAADCPDVILMDLQLPGIDGLEATRRIRARECGHHVPIVALTAFAMKEDGARARQAGCDGYITKPIDVATFLWEVERHMTPAHHTAPG